MRKLTIKKEKSHLSRFSKTRICIYDPNSTDIKINKQPYRILGILKNGEEKTFQIDDAEIQILAFNDNSSRHITNDIYNIPAGTEDITLTGKDNSSLTRGTFEFDNSTSESTLEHRKEQKKSVIVLLVSIAIAIIFINLTGAPKQITFTVDEMQIILPDSFVDETAETRKMLLNKLASSDQNAETLTSTLNDAYFYSDNVFVTIKKEPFESFLKLGIQEPQNISIEEYAEMVKTDISNENKVAGELQTQDDVTYFEHTFTVQNTGENLKYINFLYKTNTAFWMVSFSTLEEEFDNHRPSFFTWEKTIKIKDTGIKNTTTQAYSTETYTEMYPVTSSNVISISANGGIIYWSGNSKYETETMNFAFQPGEKTLYDALGNSSSFEVKRDGKQLTGWTVYEAEAIDFLDKDIDGDATDCILLGKGYDTIYYTYASMINPKLYSKSLSTEELCNIEVQGSNKSYVAFANWE